MFGRIYIGWDESQPSLYVPPGQTHHLKLQQISQRSFGILWNVGACSNCLLLAVFFKAVLAHGFFIRKKSVASLSPPFSKYLSSSVGRLLLTKFYVELVSKWSFILVRRSQQVYKYQIQKKSLNMHLVLSCASMIAHQ